MTDPAFAFAAVLLRARRTGQPAAWPAPDAIATASDALLVQDAVARALEPTDGPVVAWKVGAPAPDAPPVAAPIHAATLFAGSPGPRASGFRLIGIEAELAYRFDRAPALDADGNCTADALDDAIGAVHVAIEIIDTRFDAMPADRPLFGQADQGNHGALIIGPGRRDWRAIDPATAAVRLSIGGDTVAAHRGGNPAGDPFRLLRWLAGHAASRGRPLVAGTWVTTGSTTGARFVAPGTAAEARFDDLGTLRVDVGR